MNKLNSCMIWQQTQTVNVNVSGWLRDIKKIAENISHYHVGDVVNVYENFLAYFYLKNSVSLTMVLFLSYMGNLLGQIWCKVNKMCAVLKYAERYMCEI